MAGYENHTRDQVPQPEESSLAVVRLLSSDQHASLVAAPSRVFKGLAPGSAGPLVAIKHSECRSLAVSTRQATQAEDAHGHTVRPSKLVINLRLWIQVPAQCLKIRLRDSANPVRSLQSG